MLNPASIWNVETDSEPELDIRFHEDMQEEESASDDATLQNVKKRAAERKHTSPIKITPDKLMITFGDKTTTITNTKKTSSTKNTRTQSNRTPRHTKTNMEHNTRWYNHKLFTNNNNTRHTQSQRHSN